MPDRPTPLYCDEDVSVVLAAILRARGLSVTTTRDSGRLGLSDQDQPIFAAENNHVLLTHNRRDFERRLWLESGRRHAGIIVARRRLPHELAGRVGRLLARLSADDFPNQIFFA